MTKAGVGDWKTPLGYYEKAIAELERTRKEFQTELQILRELQVSHSNLKAELQAAQAEIQTLKAELKATKAEFKANNEHLENIVAESQKAAKSVHSETKTAQDTANAAFAEIKSVKAGIENGEIVAQKALMLQGKDDNHWMRFCKLDSINHHCFQVWKGDGNTWHNDIRVKAATFLRARDDNHWMGCHRVDSRNNDVFDIWKDQRWHSTSRVQVATRLR
ncbi:hypothetical protein H6F61_24680 [Cyanobacteria bacterium FACHB-472]|nr:hypothetical protein [Cyanobacteria bacterium FACHB-472]